MEKPDRAPNPLRLLLVSFLAALAFLSVPAGGEESPRPLKAVKLVRLGGRAFDRPLAACPDGDGGCLIVLETSGRYAVGRGNVRSKQVERWLVRLDGSMKWSWAENLKSPAGEGDEGFGVCPAGEGAFLVGGLALPRAGKGPLRIFLMGEDIQGRRKFRKRFGGSKNGFYALCAAPDGGCWFAASITGKMRAGKTVLESEGGEPLHFLARADANGSLLFALPLSRRGEVTSPPSVPTAAAACGWRALSPIPSPSAAGCSPPPATPRPSPPMPTRTANGCAPPAPRVRAPRSRRERPSVPRATAAAGSPGSSAGASASGRKTSPPNRNATCSPSG